MFSITTGGKSGSSRLQSKTRIGLGLLHWAFGEPDALQLIVKAKVAVGDALVGNAAQVISQVPQAINNGIERKNVDVLNILRSFKIDPALPLDQQDRAVVIQEIRNHLATIIPANVP